MRRVRPGMTLPVALHLHAQYRAMLLDPRGRGRRSCRPCTLPPIQPRFATPSFPIPRQAWVRLALALVIGSIGSVGMWSVVVVLPVVQAEFGATRGAVSLAFTLTMLGFGLGGVVTGKITDRFGIVAAIGAQHRHPRARLCRRRAVDHAVAIHPGAFPDRARHVGDLRAADGGGLALVRALSRAGGRPSPPAAIMSAARSGRRWSIGACSRPAGAPPISPSAFSAPWR